MAEKAKSKVTPKATKKVPATEGVGKAQGNAAPTSGKVANNVETTTAATEVVKPTVEKVTPTTTTSKPIESTDGPSKDVKAESTDKGHKGTYGEATAYLLLEDALEILTSKIAQSPNSISEAQSLLYNGISRALRDKSVKSFTKVFDKLLDFIESDKTDSFSSKKAFRGFNNLVGLSGEQISEFENVLQILVTAAPKSTRHSLMGDVNWPQVTTFLMKKDAEEVVKRIREYFNVS